MFSKKILAAAAAAAAIAASTAVYAVQSVPDAAAPAAQASQSAAKIALGDAVAAAQKEMGGKALGARLVQSPGYGLVWSVGLQNDDGTVTRAFVDAQTGKVVASGAAGMFRGQGRGYGPRGDCPMGMMNGDCPMGGPGAMRGYGPHHSWGHDGWGHRGNGCWW